MNNELEEKLIEYEQWALTLGGYSPSTTERAVRRVRYMSKKIKDLAKVADSVTDQDIRDCKKEVLEVYGVKK